MRNGYNSMIWEIGTLIKLVAGKDIRAISMTANQLRKRFNVDDIDSIDNRVIYDCYCKYAGDEL